MKWIAAVSAAALTACGGGSGKEAPVQEQNIRESIERLEASGQLPKLDRSASRSGPDINANGVRDDVDAYIAGLSDSTEQKRSLVQLAQAMNATLTVDTRNEVAMREVTDQLNHAVACIWKKYPTDLANQKVAEMRKVTVNTKTRYDAYTQYGAAMSGSVIKLPGVPNCD